MSETKSLRDVITGLIKKSGTEIDESIQKWLDGPALTAEQVPETIYKPLEEKTFGKKGAINNPEIRNVVRASTFEKLERDLRARYKDIFPGAEKPFDEWYKAQREGSENKNIVDIIGDVYGLIPEEYGRITAQHQNSNEEVADIEKRLNEEFGEKVANLERALKAKEGDLKVLAKQHKDEIHTLTEKNLSDQINWKLNEVIGKLPYNPTLKKSPNVYGVVKQGLTEQILSSYNVRLSDSREVQLYQKDNPELRVVDPETNEPVTVDAVARKFASEAEYLDANPPKGDAGGQGGSNGGGPGFRREPSGQQGVKQPQNIGGKTTTSWLP